MNFSICWKYNLYFVSIEPIINITQYQEIPGNGSLRLWHEKPSLQKPGSVFVALTCMRKLYHKNTQYDTFAVQS